jgi:hypothetical protein
MKEFDIKINLAEYEVEFLKEKFSEKIRIPLDGYHSAAISLSHKGLIASTDLNEEGKKTKNTYLYTTEIGNEIIKQIAKSRK